ncbi:MAG: hypothetical protein EU535_03195 [Promethearchaeota archaeon]|nr:MAG: hypothetical protein EU535_03195 [Candidatus Lokiarchaeota archaeon]
MNEDISKKSLEQSIELISELKFDEEDYDTIFEKFKDHLKKSKNDKLYQRISEFKDLENERELPNIMKKLVKNLNIEELNTLLREIVKNEDFVDFIQDLFLEKLI